MPLLLLHPSYKIPQDTMTVTILRKNVINCIRQKKMHHWRKSSILCTGTGEMNQLLSNSSVLLSTAFAL